MMSEPYRYAVSVYLSDGSYRFISTDYRVKLESGNWVVPVLNTDGTAEAYYFPTTNVLYIHVLDRRPDAET